MADELYEVIFSGQVREGSDPEATKARVGAMFKARDEKLEQLFSGKRIVIKRNADRATAEKYRQALASIGAECEIVPMSTPATGPAAAPAPAALAGAAPSAAAAVPAAAPPESAGAEAGASASAAEPAPAGAGTAAPATAPPSTDPLGITAEQISDLDAGLAPVGAELGEESRAVPEPQYDLSALEMAPVGSTLSDEERKPPPPPPDTSGLSLAE